MKIGKHSILLLTPETQAWIDEYQKQRPRVIRELVAATLRAIFREVRSWFRSTS